MSAASANECPNPEEYGQHRYRIGRRVWACELCGHEKPAPPAKIKGGPDHQSARVPSQRTIARLRAWLGR